MNNEPDLKTHVNDEHTACEVSVNSDTKGPLHTGALPFHLITLSHMFLRLFICAACVFCLYDDGSHTLLLLTIIAQASSRSVTYSKNYLYTLYCGSAS